MTQSRGIGVLVVEGDATEATQLQVLLDGLGSQSEVARSISEASEVLKGGGFDAVLLDLMLPDSGGIEALVKATDAPIVVLASTVDEELAIEALERGAQDYLLKSEVNARVLGRALRYAIERQRIKRRLEQLNAQKNQFLGIAAHDLRSPLAVVTMYCRLLAGRKGDNLTDLQRAHIANIERTSTFMLQLVNGLLDLSRIESGELNLDLEETDAVELAGKVLELHSLAAEAKDLTLQGHLPRAPLLFEVDRRGLQQVLHNLIGNAIKFTPKGGRIALTLTEEARAITFEVRDRGIGIPEHLISRLFTPDRTTQRTGTEGERGHGLGLAIVRKLVEAHGGTLEVESQVGLGSTFTARFPTSAPAGV